MSKSEAKTQQTKESVEAYIAAIPDEQQRQDCQTIHQMMQKASGDKGSMWGPSIVGYGMYTYRYASGTTGDWPRIGFSPRKGKTTLYLSNNFGREYKDLLQDLGPHSVSKACLYIKRLDDIDQSVLQSLMDKAYKTPAPGEV